jgi:hypothetical protein
MHKLGSLLFLCFAIMCPAQGTSGSSTATSSSGTLPAQAAKTPGTTPAKKSQEKTSAQDKKKTGDKKAEGPKRTEEQQKSEAKKAADEQAAKEKPKTTSSEVICAAFYFENKNPGPANLSEIQKYCADSLNPQQQEKNIPNAGLGDDFFLWVTRNQGKLTGEDGEIAASDLRLFINEIEIDESKCHLVAADDSNAIVEVRLERPQSSKSAWNQILANGGLRFRNVRVTIGADKKKPLPSRARLGLYLMQWKWYFWLFLGIFFVLAIVLLKNDRFKNMLRDDGPVKGPAGAITAYSLSRVQMAYWFALSIVAYVLIWGITGDRDTITNDILTLIGISAGTFLGAVSIDSSKKSQAQTNLPAATAKLVQAQNVAAAATVVVNAAPADPSAVANANLATQTVAIQHDAVYRLGCQATAPQHKGSFWTDILCDADGISFHRFQIVAWSLVLGVIFVNVIFTTLSMPTFGNTLLGLMGISSGTYLGFKFPEQKTP